MVDDRGAEAVPRTIGACVHGGVGSSICDERALLESARFCQVLVHSVVSNAQHPLDVSFLPSATTYLVSAAKQED